MNLKITNLNKKYGSSQILEDVNFDFESGKIYGLIGKNGAVKTTFFNCLNGSVSTNSGSATLTLDDGNVSPLSSMHIGYIESEPVLPDFLTGKEYLDFLLDIQNRNRQEAEKFFGLVDLLKTDQNRLIKQYSHGMKNKLQMLTLLICETPVIFLDEPFTSLDIIVAADIKKIIKDMKKDHIIIFSTHILQLATELCDEIILLHNRKITPVESNLLQDKNFEEKIISLLKDENYEKIS